MKEKNVDFTMKLEPFMNNIPKYKGSVLRKYNTGRGYFTKTEK